MWRQLNGSPGKNSLVLPARHLVTHGVVVGMTGSGKTGLITVMVEEALSAGIPTIIFDIKGDLPNLLLSFPDFDPARLAPWVESDSDDSTESSPLQAAAQLSEMRRAEFAKWNIDEARLKRFHDTTAVRVITPGATAGEPLHVLSSLERRSPRWDSDPEAARDALSAAVSLVLRLIGRDGDPARSREHVLLSVLAERRFLAGKNAELGALMEDLEEPAIDQVGALPIDSFLKKTERRNLAAALNNLLASPTFASWRQGASLDVAEWVTPRDGRTPAVIVSVAHLDDEERAQVLGVVLEELLCWVRTLGGSQRLKTLVVFDEVYGFLPPHPANPPTKRPLVALMKQARAFGVGVVVATQNPMDLDYRALSNAGLWCLGRLQTDADRERVIDGLAGAEVAGMAGIEGTLQRLQPRWFVVRNAHSSVGPVLLQPRYAMTLMHGPMTRAEIRRAREWRASQGGAPPSSASAEIVTPCHRIEATLGSCKGTVAKAEACRGAPHPRACRSESRLPLSGFAAPTVN
jgi:DNA helicase HerA-like ATPase